MSHSVARGDARSAEQLREHYEIERALADRLRHSDPAERGRLYASLYDELFRRVPHHPQLTRRETAEVRARGVDEQMKFLRRFLRPDATFAEIGPGDCALALRVAPMVRHVSAIDVSSEITSRIEAPDNFRLTLSDGVSVPLPAGSVSLIYSNQLMEHLHPDDARDQLHNIYRALADGGVYVCLTPNRWTGPHDISAHFDEVAKGFHLKEYSHGEIVALFEQVGFSKVQTFLGAKGRFVPVPTPPISMVETAFGCLSHATRMRLRRKLPFRLISTIRAVGYK
jgi:SAM-dependent methyltransferase